MSPREQAQNRIVVWLTAHKDQFNAPYGIIPSVEVLPKGGKIRTVTFGVARWLDCYLMIWSPNRITVEAQGSMASKFQPTYFSVDELLADLEKMI